MNLYEVKTVDGEMIIEGALLKEIAEILDVSIGVIRNAVYQEYVLQGKYNIQKVDEKLSKTRDNGILMEFEFIRNEILKHMKKHVKDKEGKESDRNRKH